MTDQIPQGNNAVNMQAPPQKKGSALKWILLGGCGCVTIGIVGAVLLFSGVFFAAKGILKKADKKFSPVIDRFTQLLIENDINGSYAMCSPEFKRATDRESYENFVNSYIDILTSRNRTLTRYSFRNNIHTLFYEVTTSKGKTYYLQYGLVNINGQWYIYAININ